MRSGSLRNRILLGYGLVLLLLTVALAWSFLSLVRLGRASSAILSENYRSIVAAETMVTALEDQEDAVLLAMLGSTEAAREQYREAGAEFQRQLAGAKENVTEPGEPEILERIASGHERYDRIARTLLNRSMAGGDPATRRLEYFDAHLPAMQTVRHDVARLRDLNQQAMYAASREAESLSERMLASAGLLGLTAIAVGLVLSVVLSRHLTRPLERMRRAAVRVSEGDYDVAVDIPGSDELGFLALQFNDMVERLRLYRDLDVERVLREKLKTDAILREMSDGLVMVDAAGRILHVNPAGARALGMRSENLVGRAVGDALPGAGLGEALQAALSEDGPARTGVVERPAGERPHAFQYAISRVGAGPGAPIGVLAVLRDVTEMRELDRLKSEFVATASHELRTPITTIGMSLALLEERLGAEAGPRVTALLAAAREDAGRLKRLVDDLLDLSKIEAGKAEPRREPVDLAALLHEVEGAFRLQAEGAGIDLATDALAPDMPAAYADLEQIRRAVTNLVVNAIRYSPRGGRVRLGARVVDRGVKIEVRDTGPGIAPRQRARIFEKFARADVPGAAGGSGLGLALAREIVEAHGGEIDVEPNAGGGSVFTIVLPAAPRPAGSEAPAALPGKRS